MRIDVLKKYALANSSANSRNYSLSIDPVLLQNSNDFAVFSCEGSTGSTYSISVFCDTKFASANCSCPYNYEGICKHSIAAIRVLTDLLEDEGSLQLDFGERQETWLQPNEILLDQGILKGSTIDQLGRINTHYYHQFYLNTISFEEITTTCGSWETMHQVFNYDKKTRILTTKCSCSKVAKMCDHRILALKEIIELFGEDFFSDTYWEDKIGAYLSEYGLTVKDDYRKIFDFQLTTEGIKAKELFRNIQPVAKIPEAIFKNPEAKLLAQLPYKAHQNDSMGLGICFLFYKKNFEALLPVRAKYNKLKTDFASSFAPIHFYNLDENFILFEAKKEQDLILQILQINKLTEITRDQKDPSYLSRAIQHFNAIVPELKKNILYFNDTKNTLTRKNLVPLTIQEKEIQLFFTLSESELFYSLKAKIRIDDKKYAVSSAKISITPYFIKIESEIIPISNTDLSLCLFHYKQNPETNYFKKDFKTVYDKVILPLSQKYEIQTTIYKKEKAIIEEESLEKHLYISDLEGQYIVFKPAIQYKNQLVPAFSKELLLNTAHEEKVTYSERNQSFEDNFIEELKSLHPEFENQNDFFYLTPEQLFENYWMLHATDRMKQMGITVFGANELKSFKFNINKPVINVSLKSDIDWFDIEIDINFGSQKVNIKELQKSFLKKSNYVTLGDGTLGILPEEWMKKFANYFKTGEVKKNGIQLSNYQFGIIDELYQEMETKPTFLVDLYHKKKRLQSITEIETVALPKGIKATLREYQHHGFNWLVFLDKNQLGGCLADDMGLGKTLQTIVFLQHLKTTTKNRQPSLILAPTSLIFNWKNEIEKFCPTLKILSFVGPTRLENKDHFKQYDIVISTYGSLLNDVEFLKDFKFNYIILDESQAIKNPNSKRYKAVKLLNSFNKLALTGTPIENNTFDLYAQLNFLNPGLLGNMSHFKTTFSDAIDNEKDVDASLLLSKIITPFMLRRTKEQVAKELPEKTESIIFCEMGKEQRSIYNTFKDKYRNYLLNKIDENGVEKSQMYILEGLTKLRQICNSTALIPSEEDFGNYSVKLESLMENIKEKTGNHKILVFSQFVKMLQIVKTRLEEDQIHYEYLDGQTTNRQEKVENFQNNSDVRVFLISLKAGGTGLNLTEADYVFIIDPWWNPAVENQAIDRCYRIGQTKQVMAYRMICKDTIEEKIVSLQQKKKSVASSIIQIDEEKKSFNINEVKELFR